MTDGPSNPPDPFSGGGEMGEMMRRFDWAATALGPVGAWPESLRTAVNICLDSRFPIVLWWGPQLRLLYNDAWRPALGTLKHPALARPGREVWGDIWHLIGPMLEGVLATGQATWADDMLLPYDRHGYLEETYWTYSYSPIRADGGVGGVFTAVNETTARVVSERRMRTLRDLAAHAVRGRTAADACRAAVRTLSANPADVPFALLYLLEGESAVLADCTPAEAAGAGPAERWPVEQVARTGRAVLVDDLAPFGELPRGPWPTPVRQALALPLRAAGQARPAGVLVVGVNPCRALDDAHRDYLDLLAGQVASAIDDARAYEAQRRRAEALAELDRAKTAFFSNVSHEFRTPLTLMLGPLEDHLAAGDGPAVPFARDQLELVHRNGLRLLRLVNALLDFSRIEAGRVRACYEPTDLAALTADLASVFRSAVEKAGLSLTVDCAPLGEPAFVDREMWEKVVLNLVSNAFKFTFDGGIAVSLRRADGAAELVVSDTGTGVPADEVPRLFERFHRVQGARGRTHEGTGIGLALVQELVKLHGGRVGVRSEAGRGTAFTVTLPLGSGHLPADRLGTGGAGRPTSSAAPFVEEASRWLPDEPVPERADGPSAGRVLLADDNADMRDYVRRLLSARYEVEAVADGEAALAAARRRPPDLILSDVMMPRLDGFGLLEAVRGDPTTASVPVILLSARAGEEARVEGLDAGADDYLVKPFGARELLARVNALLELARARRDEARRKDEFLAMLAHELRNPLAPILHAVLALGQGADLAWAREVIERQVRHLTRLVDDLLDVSRVTRGKIALRKEPVELAAAVARAAEACRPLIDSRRHRLSLATTPLWVEADPTRLAQVVANLLNNAAKYTDEGGRIDVAVRRDGADAVLSVRDDGVGIPADMLPQVFGLFTQVQRGIDRSQGGLGIGLALVKSLAELHGGSVTAASEGPGRGCEFVVRLPALPEAEARPVAPPRAAARQARPRRVLVVDDNRDAAESLALLLRVRGHDVRTAGCGEACLATAAEFVPEVVFLDVGLPGMDGYEVCRRLRQEARPTPLIVAVTGYGQAEDRRRSREAGFDHHLVKPAEPSALFELLAGP